MSSHKAYRFFLTAYYMPGMVGDKKQEWDVFQDVTTYLRVQSKAKHKTREAFKGEGREGFQ